jgi:hypothetical protein
MTRRPTQQIACQQVLLEDNSVFSIQWTDLPAGLPLLTGQELLQHYLRDISQQTWGLVRPLVSDQGIAFALAGRLPLLSFLPPEPVTRAEGDGLALRICGGWLVQPAQCERGELLLLTATLPDSGQRITLRLADYCPLLLGSLRPSWLRRWLYRLTQAALHRLVTIRFLARLYRRLAGPGACIRTVPVAVRDGRRT